MPVISILTLGLDVICAMHVMKTGRPYQWMFLIFMVPVAGALAYATVEMLPDLRHSRTASKAIKGIGTVIDPNRDLREAFRDLDRLETVESKLNLAKECLSREHFEEARQLLESCLTGVHADDPAMMQYLAQARFGLTDYGGTCEVLDRLRAAHPDLRSPECHLLYARSIEAEGNADQALIEYQALVDYYSGEEARCRYALLLQKLGQVDEARAQFSEVKRAVERASKVYSRAQRDWYQVAQQNLG